ncbi:hypothetical protein OGM63_27845 [Plectonema radiosum NIES-515]|uniref:Transposase n=1 Tax=Plectonema radiosum NIES-515 TaxID=2986073 RepID=A0ABT3B7C1_9CYAN|nr:hypothetical protein [Plectonema radiosum NIES-515]
MVATKSVTSLPVKFLKMNMKSAIAIIEGINHRAKQGHYQVERFTFN